MDVATFRADFPEFASTASFPDSAVSFWLSIATLRLNVVRWDTLLNVGLELFTAHQLVLEAQASRSAAAGALPGLNTGAIAGKTVDKVSITYAAESGSLTDAGHWNLTTYGTRFMELSRMLGSGGLQLGVGCDVAGSISSSGVLDGFYG